MCQIYTLFLQDGSQNITIDDAFDTILQYMCTTSRQCKVSVADRFIIQLSAVYIKSEIIDIKFFLTGHFIFCFVDGESNKWINKWIYKSPFLQLTLLYLLYYIHYCILYIISDITIQSQDVTQVTVILCTWNDTMSIIKQQQHTETL